MDSRRSAQTPAKPLRAIVEVIDGELKIYPLGDSDVDEKRILDALRFVIEDHRA
jgi:hypothetical protein